MNPAATASRPRQKTGSFSGDVIPKGYQKKPAQLQQYTDQQLGLLEHAMSFAGPDSYLSRLAGGDEELFNEMEAPAHRQFQEILGGLGTRFSAGGGQGSLGTRRSSGFQNTGTAAASNFAQDLQSRRQELQRQAIMDLQGISATLLDKRPFERSLVERAPKQEKTNKWGSLAGGIVGGVGGAFLGDPVSGATFGSAVGGML
jgi:hypothetical protein